MEITLSKAAKEAIDRLFCAGFEAYGVGGCVRDCIMGKTPNDFDVTTSALPEQIIKCFEGYRVIETGIRHGTVTVMIEGEPIEVTTFRVDGDYKDNRRPESVKFVSNLLEDLARRDFTVNAMAYSHHTGLVDAFDGIKDISNKLIRCVGDPDRRFEEDALRIMRALRFASTLGFDIHKDTAISIHKNKDLLKNISNERIFSELCKLICGKNAENILLEFKDVIAVIIPELEPSMGFDQMSKYHCYDVYEHTSKTLSGTRPDLITRLAALFHDCGKPAACTFDGVHRHFMGHDKIGKEITFSALKRLKADNFTVKTVSKLVGFHDAHVSCAEKSIKKLLAVMSYEEFVKFADLRDADRYAHAKEYSVPNPSANEIIAIADRIIAQNACLKISDLAVNGEDLKNVGIAPGKEMGLILKKLLSLVLDQKCQNDKEELLKIAVRLKKDQNY